MVHRIQRGRQRPSLQQLYFAMIPGAMICRHTEYRSRNARLGKPLVSAEYRSRNARLGETPCVSLEDQHIRSRDVSIGTTFFLPNPASPARL
ncbi:hypothetical protein AVEN_39183-1 [Araneus ventricosus]|uniref:Uncharacterized protein n=1 Tax=Araneus ventricosus TaxID=182803 RepID=A0A4Y2MLN2_ARAVE|nr:hypothetical protein AVEN_39183-1 [Araneus ventricosus]